MTNSEFEEYLKSIGGLVSAYNVDGPPIKHREFFSVNNGWLPLVKELIEKLISLDWDRHIVQVKEKFGGLRFYICSGTTEMNEVIDSFESNSFTICEDCGLEGVTRDDLRWIRTLCDEHYKERKNR